MHSRIIAIIRKETRELLRDRVYLGLTIGVPLVVMVLIGLGFILDVKNLPVAVYDEDHSPLSREYLYALTNSEYFRFKGFVDSAAELDRMIQSGSVRAGVVIPPDFSRKLHGQEPASIQVLIDGSFPSRAEIVYGYITAINSQFNAQLLSEYLERKGYVAQVILPVTIDTRIWFNPSLEGKNFTIPGFLVIVMMIYPSLVATLVVVREKEHGTIFNLVSSPVRRWEIIIGKAIPYVGIAVLDYLLLFTLSITAFRPRFVGSFFVLTAGAVVFVTCCVGLGLLISVSCKTQVAAMLLTFIAMFTTSMLFSGLITPIVTMDRSAQLISRLLPASYFMAMARGVFLKGLGFSFYSSDLVILAFYGAVVYLIAILAFRKRMP
jgi:ABC-2 type transport system permease protein